jgi:benzoyl-CoA 2,3-dioxygenase component B
MSSINYSEKIPNNVNLAEDRTLQRALEQWQPNFINWWDDVGPDGSTNFDVYLRTAVSVDPTGWAHFDYVKMRDYRSARARDKRPGPMYLASIVQICAASS